MITLTQDSSKTKTLCLPCPCCSLSPCPSLVVSGPTVELLCNAKAEIGEGEKPASLGRYRRFYQLSGPREEREQVRMWCVVSGKCGEW